MEINIIDDKKNPLLSRREIICMVTKKGTTPSKNDLGTQVSNELKLKRECVFIDAVYQKYGQQTSEVHVKVYDKKELVPGYEKPKKDTDSAEAKKESESKATEETKEASGKKEEAKEEKAPDTEKKEKVKEEKAPEAPEKKEEVKEEKKEEPKKEEKAPDTEKKEEASKEDDTIVNVATK